MANAESQSEADALAQYDVFLSHAGYDGGQKLEVSMLCNKLVSRGVKAFFDNESLKPGTGKSAWSMLHAVATAKIVIVVLSPEFVCRTWCLKEVEFALARVEDRKSRQELLSALCEEEELPTGLKDSIMNSDPAIIFPVFHSLSPDQCKNVFESVVKKNPMKFIDWLATPITLERWQRALNEIVKVPGLEYIERAGEWNDLADKVTNDILKLLGERDGELMLKHCEKANFLHVYYELPSGSLAAAYRYGKAISDTKYWEEPMLPSKSSFSHNTNPELGELGNTHTVAIVADGKGYQLRDYGGGGYLVTDEFMKKTESLSKLSHENRLPHVAIVCMRFGAQAFAEKLHRLGVKEVVYIEAPNPNAFLKVQGPKHLYHIAKMWV